MKSIRLTFTRAATISGGISLTALFLLALAIDDDAKRADKRKREKRERAAKPPRKPGKPLSGPRPW